MDTARLVPSCWAIFNLIRSRGPTTWDLMETALALTPAQLKQRAAVHQGKLKNPHQLAVAARR